MGGPLSCSVRDAEGDTVLIEVFVLAGGQNEDGTFRSDWQYQGKSFSQIAVDAFCGVGPVTQVGGTAATGIRAHLPGGKNFIDSMQTAVSAATAERILVVAADMPFVTSAAAQDLVANAPPRADVVYPIIGTQLLTGIYGELPRTTLRLKEGTFTGGNAFLMNREFLVGAMPRVQSLYDNRKSVLKLVRTLGFGTVLAVLKAKINPNWASLAEFERRIGAIAGGNLSAYQTPYAELGVDVDNSGQYAWLQALENRS